MKETGSGSELGSDYFYPELEKEAINSIRSWKWKQKIPKVRKQKRTQKHKTLKGAGSGSIKNLIASTSLVRGIFSAVLPSSANRILLATLTSHVLIVELYRFDHSKLLKCLKIRLR